ncbi:hypothetical protein HYH03_019077 [Edaphochlamys debaryana]|uniref:Uncharacterized protein n=1 Tax=Edaphochlamys debaryana TaxID=47281 RepID=A0A835XIY2_9CHLO|nr:hypothetical protein HYH03_019077 [Edaphochlamys debaryana]|eukprot:KAG2481970.1 hypothetical protein HYH03_019077 [Edaphochlamys debaryana]
MLTLETAADILRAFPRLERLRLGWWQPQEDDTASLERVDADFADALQLRERGNSHLSFLDLQHAPLTPAIRTALSGATQLTSLKLPAVRTAEEIQAFNSLTSLKDFGVTCDEAPVLRALLSPLTALTSLTLGGSEERLPPTLAGLSSLALLNAESSHLDVGVLATLTALTELRVYALALPEAPGDAFEALAAPEHRHPWQLPPQLTRIQINTQPPEPLHVMRSSPVRKLTWLINDVELKGDVHLDYSDDEEDGAGMPYLILDCLALSHQDFQALSRHTTLKALHLASATEYLVPALLPLPRAPRLERLDLMCLELNFQLDISEGEAGADAGAAGGSGDDGDPDGNQQPRAGARAAAIPPDLPGVLTALLCMGRRLHVVLNCVDSDAPEALSHQELTALVADVRSAAERLGGDGGRLHEA